MELNESVNNSNRLSASSLDYGYPSIQPTAFGVRPTNLPSMNWGNAAVNNPLSTSNIINSGVATTYSGPNAPVDFTSPSTGQFGTSDWGNFNQSYNAPEVTTEGFNWGELANTKGLGGMALGVGSLALGGFNAWMGLKNQKFLEDYYGKEQARNTLDFNNNVDSTNEKRVINQKMRMGNSGIDPDSATGQAALSNYMNTWGSKRI